MDYVHRPYTPGETIAAIATPPGEGGIAIIRISGDRALIIADQICSLSVSEMPTHTARLGRVLDKEGEVIDKVLFLLMRAPRSYTGEETVEIHCHGGSLIARRVLERVLAAGARAAGPGEFTFRAFQNGKLDLAQAEAVQTLIAAKNRVSLEMAKDQLEGLLSQKITHFQRALIDIAAILEAWVDFPEEGLEFASLEEILLSLEGTKREMEALYRTFEQGRIIHEGLSLCLSGAPNVGKSSLMNALLGRERAIVTPIPGTTRDLLDAEMRLGSLHFKLVDTAGIREADELIEAEGIRRTRSAIDQADLVLFLMDASRAPTEKERELLAGLPEQKTLLVWNKVDLNPPPLAIAHPHWVAISAKERRGLEGLQEKIEEMIWRDGPPSKDEVMLTSLRHHTALGEALEAVERLISGLQSGVSAEFAAADMREALLALGTIIGNNIGEEILSAIFSKFCVGK